ncbi:lipase family protein [Pseudooctadecabacter sp.]|uniref:lipase family protein n=1 Tax=Pseudooctadecabacter sp. TaxID=1966338 RepID=UPI0025FF4D6C|nr:hypothetical protein [Pseudooctadecabacter sp.]
MTKPFPLHDAQVQMTLAALAYLDDTDPTGRTIPPVSDVKKALIAGLANCDFSTKGEWTLAWGPIQTHGTDNLVYVARNETDKTLAVCLRGTTTQWLSRLEDIPTSQRRFPTANTSGAKVSSEFFTGLVEMLAAVDPDQSTTLQDYLATQVAAGFGTVFVNGHSQGAALVPMMMAALQLGWARRPGLRAAVRGFAFAPPTSGNPAFADWVNRSLDCWFVINPLDIVPLGYANIHDVTRRQIPGPLTLEEELYVPALVDAAAALAWAAGTWAQPDQRAMTQMVHEENEGFFDMVIDQHNHNTYLVMLGATPLVPFGQTGASPFAPGSIPLPHITNVPVGP